MTLADLGYTPDMEAYRKEQNLDSFLVGRVTAEHKERYVVRTDQAEYDAELIGNLRFTAKNRYDFPAVGDWVAISEFDENKALIHAVFPRQSIMERQAVGKHAQKQIIATNIDCGLIVQAVDRDFSINRLERYLTICNTAHVEAIIILSKIDLIEVEAFQDILKEVTERIPQIPVIPLSSQTLVGYDQLFVLIKTGKTYCLLGSSGVGKSTLSNHISVEKQMKTNDISLSTSRGKHTTSHRELILIKNGGLLIDNPGMREVGITDTDSGLEMTFDAIVQLAQNCKFNDCSHTQEKGCAILEALEEGEIDEEAYKNYLKMGREKTHFESSVREKRKKDKAFGKLIKATIKNKKKSKF